MKVIAVGNSFFGDDGVGAEVLAHIRREGGLPGAELVDLQTDALALLDHLDMDGWNVIVDAARMGLRPGEIAAFPPSDVRLKVQSDNLSLHGLGLAEAFDLARGLGKLPPKVLVVGVEPESLKIDRGLSAAVAEAVPRVVSKIKAEVQADG